MPSSVEPEESTTNRVDTDPMTRLEPWLGLRSRLFLSLFPYGLVALLFVGTRLLISSSQASTDIQHSNATIWSACRETEQAVSTLVSFPHLLADNFNSATKRSVDDTVQGLGVVLLLSITAVEALLVFLVDMYKSMFLCFIQFVVQASISLLITAVQLFSTAVHDVAQSIQVAVQSSVDATIPTVPYPNLR
jgi:cobalamin biosynthesis protein CobD/CbiB